MSQIKIEALAYGDVELSGIAVSPDGRDGKRRVRWSAVLSLDEIYQLIKELQHVSVSARLRQPESLS